ncbi:hypothetical protein JZO73_04215 [Enterococcus plantarum]|uniref:hypothetical protein n=1 Tax=Enterococcus plantarum TaxID=1077675 RepID=UPI001A8FF4E6|nr:hypothetical protein [Enterococcus plantarum]MBO0466735.1 hypothetical protein [Enterococcus plantarum]
MGRKDTVKIAKEDILTYAKYVKLFNRSEDWYIKKKEKSIERRIMYFEEGQLGKQYKGFDSVDIEDIYQEIQLVFDHKKTMIGKRPHRGAALKFTGRGEAYKEICQRLDYSQKLKIHGKTYRFKQ